MGLYPISPESPLLFPNRSFSSVPEGRPRTRGPQESQREHEKMKTDYDTIADAYALSRRLSEHVIVDAAPYRERAFSCLRLIDDVQFEEGLRLLEEDLRKGPVRVTSEYVCIWGEAPTKHCSERLHREGSGRGRVPQAPGPDGGSDRVGDGEGQAELERLQDLQLLDGIQARKRQDAQCAPGKLQEDGCRASSPEGQGEEGGGAGDAGAGRKATNVKLHRVLVHRGRNEPMFQLRGFAPSRETGPC